MSSNIFFLLIWFILLFLKNLDWMLCLEYISLLYPLAFGVIIDRVADSVNTPGIRQILNNKVLLFIGKISYGIYLFHNFIPNFYGFRMPAFLQHYSLYIVVFLRFLILLGLAMASWFLFEKPVLN